MTARRRHQPSRNASRVIVVGAGFAGLAAVKELRQVGAQVLLIDRNIYSTFQPLLYQVATGGLNPGDVAYPLRTLARRKAARFRPGDLAGKPAGRIARAGPGERPLGPVQSRRRRGACLRGRPGCS